MKNSTGYFIRLILAITIIVTVVLGSLVYVPLSGLRTVHAATNTIGFIGCSNSQRTVGGYFRAGGNRFWSGIGSYGGGTIVDWKNGIGVSGNQYWDTFKQYLASSPTTTIWVSVCLHPAQSDQDIYNASLAVIAEVKRLVPNAVIYFSAINGFVAPHVCGLTGADGPARANSLSDRLASEGKALRGPNVGDLLSIYQTPSNGATSANNATESDGCHPNSSKGDGQLQTGSALLAFPAFSNSGGGSPPPAQCNDGLDNDRDGKTDLADPGCSSSSDNSEAGDPPADTTPPNAPTGLTASAPSAGKVNLAWNAATDNSGGTGIDTYEIFRDGTSIGVVASPTVSYSDVQVKAQTKYSYTVRARDRAGNNGPQSSAVSVTTPAKTDTQPPTTPGGFKVASTTTSSVDLQWNASTDNKGVSGYKIFRGPLYLGSVTGTSYSDKGLQAGTTYSYSISAYDADGNESARSASIEATTASTPNLPPPVVPPPTVTTTQNGNSSITVAPPPSSKPVDHVDYLINGRIVASAKNTNPVTIPDSKLPASNCSLTVKTYGADGSVTTSQPSSCPSKISGLSKFIPKRYQRLALGAGIGVLLGLSGASYVWFRHRRPPWLRSGNNSSSTPSLPDAALMHPPSHMPSQIVYPSNPEPPASYLPPDQIS